MPGSAHYEGRAVDVFFRPVTKRNRAKGWAMAQYLVAHADRLEREHGDLRRLDLDAPAGRSRAGGSTTSDTSGRSPEVAAILEHRDHVHVDVAD